MSSNEYFNNAGVSPGSVLYSFPFIDFIDGVIIDITPLLLSHRQMDCSLLFTIMTGLRQMICSVCQKKASKCLGYLNQRKKYFTPIDLQNLCFTRSKPFQTSGIKTTFEFNQFSKSCFINIIMGYTLGRFMNGSFSSDFLVVSSLLRSIYIPFLQINTPL